MKRKIPDTISEAEVILILNAEENLKKRLAYALMFYQAMRISEVTNLTTEHIDKQKLMIHIKEAKGMKDRDIPIAPFFAKPGEQRAVGLKGLTINLRQLPINFSIRTIERCLKRISIDVLDKDIHPHTLRHSGATYYLNKKKWNIRQLQRFLGHSKITTTEIYTHVSPEDLFNKMWEGES